MLIDPVYILSAGDPETNLIYILLWVLGLTILIQSILLLVLWRRMSSLNKPASVGIGKVVDAIRLTLVGGNKRGKPLARLKVLDGPPNMIGQELNIYTESIKLGRNPHLADITFYGTDVITSVSGLHARVEKAAGSWRIVAISQSGSETFVDDIVLPFNEPVLLQNGQIIRMGYFAQQPVVIQFRTIDSLQSDNYSNNSDWDADLRKTDISDSIYIPSSESSDFFEKPNIFTKPQSEDADSIFDEFR